MIKGYVILLYNTTNNTFMAENTDNIVLQRNVRRCTQCRQEGHNIRNCPIFPRTHKRALRKYEEWITHCIVDYYCQDAWNYSVEPYNIAQPENTELMTFLMDNRNNENALTDVIKTPYEWLTIQTIETLRILAHVYSIPYKREPYKRYTKEQWIETLHLILVLEADKIMVRQYSVPDVLMYLNSSIQGYSALEYIYDKALENIPNILDANTHLHIKPLDERYQRVRELRYYSTRNLRFATHDLERNQRDLRDIRRRLSELRNQRTRLENNQQQLEERVRNYEIEISMFDNLPPEPPKILLYENNNRFVIDTFCPICYEDIPLENMCTIECCHSFCNTCIFQTIIMKYKHRDNVLEDCSCPMCRKSIKKMFGNRENMVRSFTQIIQKNNIPEMERFVRGEPQSL